MGPVMDAQMWLQGILAFLTTGLIGILVIEMNRTRNVLTQLNVQIAQILERVSYHGVELERHEDRISRLEKS